MESRLLEILVCPLCKGSLHYKQQEQELVCNADKLAFPIRDGVPIMLESEARSLAESNQAGHQQGTSPASHGTSPASSHTS
jgi:uncharacterized protein YbaR (Trm112 family)